ASVASNADEDTNVTAQLSCNTDVALPQTDLTAPAGEQKLYVLLTGGVTSFKGAELDLSWSPMGDQGTCVAHVGNLFATSTGNACTYLNRAPTNELVTADEPGHLHLSWTDDTSVTTCPAGAILVVRFQFDGCPTTPVTFRLCSLSVRDSTNNAHVLAEENLGEAATVNGG